MKPCTFKPKLDTNSLEMQKTKHSSIVQKTQALMEQAKKSIKDSQ
jgi:hypothetical protein